MGRINYEDYPELSSAASPYELWSRFDVVQKMQHLLKRGYVFNAEGRLTSQKQLLPENVWIHTNPLKEQDCHFYNEVLFLGAFQQRLIPSYCSKCFKVVVKLDTVAQLMRFYELQQELNFPGKCGTEGDRKNTGKLYAGYFYCRGLEEGLERYAQVRKAVDVTEGLGNEVKIILKRACTEFEQALGSSDKWPPVTDVQLEMEHLLARHIVPGFDFNPDVQFVEHTKIIWIHNAAKWGDETYKLFTGGKALDPRMFCSAVKTYHDETAGNCKIHAREWDCEEVCGSE